MTETRFQLLEVDLTNKTSKTVDVTEDVKKHLGGRGLAAKIFWERIPMGANPLGSENMLHVGVGPVTALIGDKTVFSFKSPLFGWAGRATMSGYFGRELVNSPFNAGILLTGRSDTPVYLYVHNDDVQIRDASKYWGTYKQKAEYSIRKDLKDETGEKFAVAVIGPAGENLVRFANITHEWFHSASKWGCGAVMGSKGLKAIAVRGSNGPAYANTQEVWDLFKHYFTHKDIIAHNYRERRFGHMTSIPDLYNSGMEGIKNNNLGWHEICEKSNAQKFELEYTLWTEGCPGCANPCFIPFYKSEPPLGPVSGEFRHDNTGCFNANVLLSYEEMTYLTTLNDELGFDGEEAGGLVAWAMDLYDHGLLSKAELGGIDLKWGSLEAIDQLLRDIAYRRGFGHILADGYKYAIPKIGQESEKYAWQVHWCSCATYDLRGFGGGTRAVEYASSHNGARMGVGISTALRESATVCNFTATPIPRVWGSVEEAIRLYTNAVTGWNLTFDDINTIALRNYMLERCFSLREGYRPAIHNTVPDRAFDQPITSKYGDVWVLDRDQFAKDLKEYYINALHLTEEGLPPKDMLKQLGLDYVFPTLDSLAIWD